MSAALTYSLCNESTSAEMTEQVLHTMAGDLQACYDQLFAEKWGVLPVLIDVGVSDAGTDRVMHLVDSIPEAPDALAYHTVDDQGRPVLRLGVETIRASLIEGQSLVDEISKALSHEVFETAINPFVADFTYVAGKTVMLSKEVCDPVQGGAFRFANSWMSNFVLPAYFDAEDMDGPFDYLNTLVAPLSCAADGYQAWSDGTQTFGAEVAPHKKADVEKYGRVPARMAYGVPAEMSLEPVNA